MSETRHFLCRREDIRNGQARGFEVGDGAARREVIIVCHASNFHAYMNSCPHQAMPLEILPDKFLNEDGSLLVCSTHGARFRVEDGYCVSGPCQGKSLVPIAVEIDDASVFAVG
ncbi:MAG: Rieske 2Fe-2S domain-containing protein [Micropepsaceae bacterium]